MNIGINARFLFTDILEGIGRYSWETTKRMILYHPEDQFYLFFDRPFPERYIIAENITPVIVQPPARHPLLFYTWFEISLPRALKKHKIDVFYSPDNFMSLKVDMPTLLVVHDLAYLHFPQHFKLSHLAYYRYFMPKYINKANHIITVSNFVKKDIQFYFQVPSNRISVGYNALPARSLNINRNKPIDKDYFIFVGSLNERKNIKNLINAFRKTLFGNRDVILVLVGKPYNLSKEVKESISLGIDKGYIVHLQDLTDDKLMNWIYHAKALVYPSLFEGFGIPIIEAMSIGTPVITSNVSSMPEVAGGAAILVDPNQPEEIHSAMTSTLTNPGRVERLKKLGKERVKTFSWQRTSNIIYDKLQSLVN